MFTPMIASLLRKHAFTHALTIVLGAGALLAPSASAGAQQASAPDAADVHCVAKTIAGRYVFYQPGQQATDVDAQAWVCAPDGTWVPDYSLAKKKQTKSTPVKQTVAFNFTEITVAY